MAAFDFAQWKWDLAGLAGALALAAVQKTWREYQQRRSETWPISYGRIGKVSVDSEQKQPRINCSYTYRVGDESFSGSFQKTFDGPHEATAWAEALDQKQVAVRYDASNPSRSQLREVDLEPIVRAAAPFRPANPDAELPGWERLLASVGLVLATVGLAATVAILIGQMVGKTLVPPELAAKISTGAFVLFFVGMLASWRGGKRQVRATPSWMKYLGYALFYYAIFIAAFVPSHGASSEPGGTRRHRDAFVDARYQLFLYFLALEWCYVRLRSTESEIQPAEPVRFS